MTQNIYGLTRNNTRPRGVQFILSGSKQFRKNGGPHLKGSRRPRKKVARPLLLRRPQVVFFGAQAEKKRFFFSRRRLVMVFGGQITFSTPPKNFRPLQFFSAPHFFFSAPKTKNRLFRRASKEQRPKSCILGSTTIRASGGENCPSRFERVPGFSWNPSGGSTKTSNEGFMKPP